MHFHPIEYAKEHPWATGIIVVVGGIIFIMFSGVGKGSSTSSDGTAAPSDAEVAANATIQAAQIQAQAQALSVGAAVQDAQIGAGVQMHSDDLSAQVAMRTLDVQSQLGTAQIEAQRQTDLANIQGQTTVAVTDSNNTVATEALIASASKKQSKASSIGSIAGAVTSIAGAIGSIFSDKRLKENIKLIDRSPAGYGIYSFNYKGIPNHTYTGVIADDVQKYVPAAVSVDARTGYKKVDMSMLAPDRSLPGPAMVAASQLFH